MIAAKSLKVAEKPLRDRLAALAQDRGEPGPDAIYGHGIVQPADACR
jgi:hypothetical protein